MNTTFIAPFFEFLLHASGESIVIVALVLLVQRIARNRISPAARHALWWLVMVRLMLPWFPESSVSVFRLAPKQDVYQGMTGTSGAMAVPEHLFTLPSNPSYDRGIIQENGIKVNPSNIQQTAELDVTSTALISSDIETATPSRPASTTTVEPPAPSSAPVRWQDVLAGCWLLGVLVMGARVLIGCRRMAVRLNKESALRDRPVLDQMQTACQRFRLRKPIPMIETDLVASPALFGLFSPVLLFPRKAWQSYTPAELNHIIMHELAHVRRKDHWLNWLMTFCQILHWFNPVIWFAFGRMRADRELATDHLALKTNGDQDATAYGQTILKTLRHLSHPTSLPGLVGILEDKRHLKNRFEMMAAYLPHRRFSWLLLLLIALPLMVMTLTNPARGQDNAEVSKTITENENPTDTEEATRPVEIFKTIRIQVVDKETNSPIENANLQWWTGFPGDKNQGTTDSEGFLEVDLPPIPESNYGFSFTADHVDHVTQIIGWHWQKSSYKGDWASILPDSFTMQLSKGFEIGGVVHDKNGHPQPDVQVKIAAYSDITVESDEDALSPFIHEQFLNNDQPVLTNQQGRWEVANLPKDATWISIKLIRPDTSETEFMTANGLLPHPNYRGDAHPISLGDLKAKQAVLTLMEDGITIQGKVIDTSGNPIAGATIAESYGSTFNKIQATIQTDSRGRFTLPNRRPRQVALTASHPGFAITSIDTTIEPNMEMVTIQMHPAQTLSGRVEDVEGNPIPYATLMTDSEYAGRTFEWRIKTDNNGAFTWNEAPLSKVMFLIAKDGFPVRRIRMQPRNEPWTIVLDPALRDQITIHARVTDALTGSPIPKFDYVVKSEWNPNVFPSPSQESGENGIIETILTKNIFNPESLKKYRLVVDAPGYKQWQSEHRFFEEGNLKLEASLIKETQSYNVSGRVVVDPSGKPVSVGNVVLVGGNYFELPFINNTWESFLRDNSVSVYTNSKGEIPPVMLPDNFRGIIIFDESGYFFAQKGELATSDGAIRLKPYGTLEGRIHFGNQFIKGRKVCITNRDWISHPLFTLSFITTTDAEGRFSFPELAEGDYCLFLIKGNQKGAVIETYQTSVSIRSSETTNIRLEDEGRHVTGTIEPVNHKAELAWSMQHGFLHSIDPSNSYPPKPNFDDFLNIEDFKQAEESWRSDPEIIALRRNKRSYFLDFNEDGSFKATAVRPGRYEISIILTQEDPDSRTHFPIKKKEIASLHTEIKIPDGPMSELVDLGSFELPIVEP